jgi:DNA sulfur modification protein DndC
MDKLQESIKATKDLYLADETEWVVGFSGGKDSSLIIKILLVAISELGEKAKKPLKILYCDTGVEIPILKNYILQTLDNIQEEGSLLGVEVITAAVKPKLNNHYFVKVIGRGYPPPSNKFRWCTNRLRIDPIQSAIKNIVNNQQSIVVLGTRFEESEERNRILGKHSTNQKYIFSQSGYPDTSLFCPIINFSIDEVWEALVELKNIKSIDIEKLSNIYKLISGECPIVRLPNTNPCSKGRFGCWTCTVVRQDKATKNLIINGYLSLEPLYSFRLWLLSIRDDIKYRCTVRRNGVKGLGPFRLKARKEILNKLLIAEKLSGHKLIGEDELLEIKKLWVMDANSESYKEDFLVNLTSNKFE